MGDDVVKITSDARSLAQHRFAEPEELTGLALFLASPASDFVTGAAFTIDGGQLAGNSLFYESTNRRDEETKR